MIAGMGGRSLTQIFRYSNANIETITSEHTFYAACIVDTQDACVTDLLGAQVCDKWLHREEAG